MKEAETREQFIERLKGKKLFYKRPDGVWILYTSKYGYTTAEKQRWIADELDRLTSSNAPAPNYPRKVMGD